MLNFPLKTAQYYGWLSPGGPIYGSSSLRSAFVAGSQQPKPWPYPGGSVVVEVSLDDAKILCNGLLRDAAALLNTGQGAIVGTNDIAYAYGFTLMWIWQNGGAGWWPTL